MTNYACMYEYLSNSLFHLFLLLNLITKYIRKSQNKPVMSRTQLFSSRISPMSCMLDLFCIILLSLPVYKIHQLNSSTKLFNSICKLFRLPIQQSQRSLSIQLLQQTSLQVFAYHCVMSDLDIPFSLKFLHILFIFSVILSNPEEENFST